MLEPILVIARKEMLDSMRDVRSLLSSFLYCLMGPGIVFMVSLTVHTEPAGRSVMIGMMSVFTLVSAFTGGMNVGMDVVAGERERRSLLPLLMNAVTRQDILLGKWLAISFFSLAGLMVTLIGFGLVPGMGIPSLWIVAPGLISLAMLAAALELGISTACRRMKEAHTYLSQLTFVPMIIGMLLVFHPQAAGGWAHWMPIAGQQWQLERWAHGGSVPLVQAVVLAVLTAAAAACAVLAAANGMERDDVVYGN